MTPQDDANKPAQRPDAEREGRSEAEQRSWDQGAFGSQAGQRAGEGQEADKTPDAAKGHQSGAHDDRGGNDQRSWEEGAFGDQAGKKAGESHPGDRPDADRNHQGGHYGQGDTGKREFGHDDDRGPSPDEHPAPSDAEDPAAVGSGGAKPAKTP